MTAGLRYQLMFDRLRTRGEGAFVPFLVVGDPDPATSLELIRALARSGADALELGLPFSDPIADGPVIQAAATRALDNGVRIEDGWRIIEAIRREFPELPIGLLVYANLVLHRGAAEFYRRAAVAGVDSVLVADAPLLENAALAQAASAEGIASICIAPPNAGDDTLESIARRSEGYVYVTSRPGVTGADDRLHEDSGRLFRRLAALGAAPGLLGFGIATPDHVRAALQLGAAGAISGSAVVRHIERFPAGGPDLIEAVSAFTRAMKEATCPQ